MRRPAHLVAIVIAISVTVGVLTSIGLLSYFTTQNQINLNGNVEIDVFFAGKAGEDGLSWGTAYKLVDRSIDGQKVNSGIKIQNGDRYIIIQNCIVTNAGKQSIDAGISIINCSHIKIFSCIAKNNIVYGIYISHSTDCIISENLIENNGRSNHLDGISLVDAQYCTVERNTASRSDRDGISLYDSANCAVLENTLFNNDEDGIYLFDSTNCTVISNDADQNGYCGIHLYYGNNCSLASNNLANNSFAEIGNDYAGNITLFNNTIVGTKFGIFLNDVGANRLSYNNMSGEGIAYYGDWKLNYIENGTNFVNGDPVHSYQNETDLYLDGLINSDIGQIFLVNCNNSRIANLDISWISQGLTLLWCNNITVENNNFTHNTLHGIYLYASHNNTLSGNNASYNGYGSYHILGDGIHLENSFLNIITSNEITGNRENGIYLISASYCTVEGNSVSESNYHGIYLSSASNCTVEGNSVSESNYYGIYLSSASNCTVEGNSVLDHNYYGIRLNSASNCTVEGNSVSENNYYGINLSSATNCTVSRNIPVDNGRDGIFLYSNTNCTIKENCAYRNGHDGIYGYFSSNCVLANNDLANNTNGEIEVIYATNLTIYNNTILGTTQGIRLDHGQGNYLACNNMTGEGFAFLDNWELNYIEDASNFVNGNPVRWFQDQMGLNLDGTSSIGQLFLVNCNDSRVTNINISRASQALTLLQCNNITVARSNFTYNVIMGISLYASHNITITGNNVSLNGNGLANDYNIIKSSIYLENSNNCNLSDNHILWVPLGIIIDHSNFATITNNTLTGCTWGIDLWHASNNRVVGNNISSDYYYHVWLYYADYNYFAGNILPSRQCIAHDGRGTGNYGEDWDAHAYQVWDYDNYDDEDEDFPYEIWLYIIMMCLIVPFQFLSSWKSHKTLRKRKQQYEQALKNLNLETREFYRTHHGFDPLDNRITDSKGMFHYEETFPLDSDPPLLAADITISARVNFRADGQAFNRIIFRRGGREGTVTCTHTVIYEGPVNEAIPLASGVEAGSKLVVLPPDQISDLGTQTAQEADSTPKQVEAGVGKPADILPWEHFAALKSYVAALAEQGIGNLLVESFISEDTNPYTYSTGLNAAMQHQILQALHVVGPTHITDLLVGRMLERIFSAEELTRWFCSRFPLIEKMYQIMLHLRRSPDVQAVFSEALEKWGCDLFPMKVLECLASSKYLSERAIALLSALPSKVIHRKLGAHSSGFPDSLEKRWNLKNA